MRIDGRPTGPLQAAATRPGTVSRGSGFRLAAGGTDNAARATSAGHLHSLDALLVLQDADEDGRQRRRRSARRGSDLLDALDGLKAALLAGTVPLGELGRISDRLRSLGGPSGDPTLDDTIAAIELRAKVELAKLGVATS